MIRVALIGIGGMGNGHFNAFKSVKNAKIVAVADPRMDMAREKVNDETIKIYPDMDELLKNEEIDMVDICTPTYMHIPLAIKALEMGKHVLSEKPMSVSSRDTQLVIDTAKKCGKKYMVAHVVRFLPAYVALKNVIDSGELGELVHLDMQRLSGIPRWNWESWMMDVTKSGGCTIDMAIHDIDFAQYAFGLPKEINGVYQKMRDDNDYVTANLVYDRFSVTITGGWYNYAFPFRMTYLAVFQNGFMEFKADGSVIKNGEPFDVTTPVEEEDTGMNLKGFAGYSDEIQYFVDCINEDREVTAVMPESSQTSIKLAEEIMEKAVKL